MKRIGVLVVAYNAASTIAAVLDRLPPAFRSRVDQVLVFDDASDDDTYEIACAYQAQSDLPLTVVRHPHNLGYGGNQKAGYRWAIDHGLDIVVLLHGDGQYAPEVIEDLVAPLESGDADAVFGSRLIGPGAARLGGMPLYKYVGNRVLTSVSNAMVGMRLSEWHTGYRAYRVDALRDIPFGSSSDGFDFDTEIILQLHEARKTIVEVPIPTYYGDEVCYVNGLRYAKDVTMDVARYRMQKVGFGSGQMAFARDGYELQLTDTSTHGQLASWLRKRPPQRILNVGCGDGRFGELLRSYGHTVIGLDRVKVNGVADRLDGFVEADLNQGLPKDIGTRFDAVVAADVLGHTMDPEAVLGQLRKLLAPGGVVIVSVPNVAHWYPRLRVVFGKFDYDRRGILDAGHLRFFTGSSFERMVERVGMRVRHRSTAGLPVEVVERGGPAPTWAQQFVRRTDRLGVALWPNLFAYQFLFELEPR
jgi:glycosyltransferase involved in cell wall biosynthesis